MTNPNPSPLVVQTFMAGLLGCIWVEDKGIPDWGPSLVLPDSTLAVKHHREYFLPCHPPAEIKPYNLRHLPNWPGSHDAARGLEVRDKPRFALCLFEIVFDEKNDKDPTLMVTGEVGQLLFATSDQWCLAWIESEHGYRWVECITCKGMGAIREHAGNPIKDCPNCSGDSGEFVKIEKGASGGKQKTDHS